MTRLRKMMLEELQRRNYAKSTVKTYVRIIQESPAFPSTARQARSTSPAPASSHLFQEKEVDAGPVQQHVRARSSISRL